jgi:formylglycine-generating enzyme required for sulfatase activity
MRRFDFQDMKGTKEVFKADDVQEPDKPPSSQTLQESRIALLSDIEKDFEFPDAGMDQHGNPVVTRNGSRFDTETGYPYEVWMKNPRMEFVLVTAGEFMMGSQDSESERSLHEGPLHRVRITQPFYMAKYEVTQTQWEGVMGTNPSGLKGDDFPVEEVSWNDCKEFLNKLNRAMSGQRSALKGTGFRLPTEAQWEYACRAGTTTPFHFGKTITTNQVNYDGEYPYGNSPKGEYRQKTVRVGTFPSNAWGLHDMHGNVWEWCEDKYHPRTYGEPEATKPDPVCTLDSSYRIFRGGGWDCFAGFCRSAFRGKEVTGRSYCTLGFRPIKPLR